MYEQFETRILKDLKIEYKGYIISCKSIWADVKKNCWIIVVRKHKENVKKKKNSNPILQWMNVDVMEDFKNIFKNKRKIIEQC